MFGYNNFPDECQRTVGLETYQIKPKQPQFQNYRRADWIGEVFILYAGIIAYPIDVFR